MVRTGEIGAAATVAPRPGTGRQLREDHSGEREKKARITVRTHRRIIMEPQHVRVETLDAEVLCPYCKQTARKEGPPPGRSWPEPWDETIKDATDLIAMAFCDNPECLKCLNKNPIHWSYKKTTGGETRTAKCG